MCLSAASSKNKPFVQVSRHRAVLRSVDLGTHTHRTIARLSEALEARNNILKQVLPAVDLSAIPEQARHELNQLIETPWNYDDISPAPTGDGTQSTIATADPLQEQEVCDHEWTEPSASQSHVAVVGDDVNGLTSHRGNKSFMGAFSPGAVLHVLLTLSPAAKAKFETLEQVLVAEETNTALTKDTPIANTAAITPSTTSKPCIKQQLSAVDAYFSRIHPIAPMLDEIRFRSIFVEQRRSDCSWTALSHMVLALGSIAAGDDETHVVYYQYAREAIGYNVFCSGNLDMLQALILLGGLYLHYLNSPNSAYMIRGTAFRMAIAMGLHRESVVTAQPAAPFSDRGQQNHMNILLDIPRAEVRRFTWWSLVNHDILAGLMFARPRAFGWDPLTMDVRLPSSHPAISIPAGQSEHGHAHITDAQWVIKAFRLQSELTGVLSHMQGRVARLTKTTAQEIITLHEQLQAWVRLHLLDHKSHPKSVKRSLDIQKIHAQTACLIFSQPHLLSLAFNLQAQHTMTSDDWRVISICQDSASNIIAAIALSQDLDRVTVWRSTFNLFQASLILMLSLLIGPSLENLRDMVSTWKQSLETARNCFMRMAPYTRRLDRYGEVFDELYGVLIDAAVGRQQPSSDNSCKLDNPLAATAEIHTPPYFTYVQLPGFDHEGFPYDFDYTFSFDLPTFGDSYVR